DGWRCRGRVSGTIPGTAAGVPRLEPRCRGRRGSASRHAPAHDVDVAVAGRAAVGEAPARPATPSDQVQPGGPALLVVRAEAVQHPGADDPDGLLVLACRADAVHLGAAAFEQAEDAQAQVGLVLQEDRADVRLAPGLDVPGGRPPEVGDAEPLADGLAALLA